MAGHWKQNTGLLFVTVFVTSLLMI